MEKEKKSQPIKIAFFVEYRPPPSGPDWIDIIYITYTPDKWDKSNNNTVMVKLQFNSTVFDVIEISVFQYKMHPHISIYRKFTKTT